MDRLHDRLAGYRDAPSGLASQKADEALHVAIAEAAGNATLRGVLFELEARVSISAPAHLWGGPEGMREMELRALADHEALVAAICEGRAADAAAIAREHVKIDLELLERELGRSDAINECFYAIFVDRRISHPGVLAITRSSRVHNFASAAAE